MFSPLYSQSALSMWWGSPRTMAGRMLNIQRIFPAIVMVHEKAKIHLQYSFTSNTLQEYHLTQPPSVPILLQSFLLSNCLSRTADSCNSSQISTIVNLMHGYTVNRLMEFLQISDIAKLHVFERLHQTNPFYPSDYGRE